MHILNLTGPAPETAHDGLIMSAPREDCTTIVAEHDLDGHVATLIAANPGIGAVLLDEAGHVKLFAPCDSHFTFAPGVYGSIQAAIDAAEDGDAIYIVAGTYREQLTIRGKHLDLLGATDDDGSLLVTLESPDMIKLDVDSVDDQGELGAQCAVVRVRNHANVTMRHLLIDGRNQGSRPGRSGGRIRFASVATSDSDTVVEHVETRGFELREAVQLVDRSGHLKATFSTIQAAISMAASGEEIIIAPGVYREDLYINERVTLSRTNPTSKRPCTDAVIVGRVVVAALAGEVMLDGVAIKGSLEMESDGGVTAIVTLCNSRIDGGSDTPAAGAGTPAPTAALQQPGLTA